MKYFSSRMGHMRASHMICEYTKAKTYRPMAGVLFVDSGILRSSRDIDKMIEYQKVGDVVSSPDVMEDVGTTVSNTLKWYPKIKQYFSIDKICFVLQGENVKGYLRCLRQIRNVIPEIEYVGLGGLIVKSDVMIKEVLTLIPELKAENYRVHIFGLGTRWLRLLSHYDPYSFDSSTPMRDALSYCVYNDDLKRTSLVKHDIVGGTKLRELIGEINNEQIRLFMKRIKDDPGRVVHTKKLF